MRSDSLVDIPILCCLFLYGCLAHLETTRDDQLQLVSHLRRSFSSERLCNPCLHRETGLRWPLRHLSIHGMRPRPPLRHPPGADGVQSEPAFQLPKCRLIPSVCRRSLWSQYPKHGTVGSQSLGRSNGTCWFFRPLSSSCYSPHSMHLYTETRVCTPLTPSLQPFYRLRGTSKLAGNNV